MSAGLILSRRIGESVVVEQMRITVIDIRGGRVRIGFVGPREVSVVREELLGVAPDLKEAVPEPSELAAA